MVYDIYLFYCNQVRKFFIIFESFEKLKVIGLNKEEIFSQ